MKTNEARTLLGLQHQYQERLAEEINDLAETEWNRQDMKRLTYTLLGMNGEKGVEDHNGSVRENAKTILRLFEDGVGNSGETAWDAYNAVTEFTSHYKGHGRSVESIGSTDEKIVSSRLTNNWFGEGTYMRDKAWGILRYPTPENLMTTVGSWS